jgi:AcrR family transcriptional regulator
LSFGASTPICVDGNWDDIPPFARLDLKGDRMADRIPMMERILAAADRLFYRKGIRAVGVDAVAAEAGISKRSLYDTFPSKDALVAAYLRQRIQPFVPSDHPPALQVLALFDQLRYRFEAGGFRGCPFVNAVTELAEDCNSARAIAAQYKADRLGHIADLLEQAGAADPGVLASQVGMLFEGAIAAMLVGRDSSAATRARDAASVLMRVAGVAPVKFSQNPGTH